MKENKKVAIIGTVGVPANYGGFESLVENILGENASPDIAYTVYCSSKNYDSKLSEYKKAKLKYIPLDANGAQSIIYDIISLLQANCNNDIIVILGVSGCIFLPIYRMFSRKRIIINIDGLEHKRDKWGKWAKRFLKFSEKMAVKYADVIVTDNKGIQDYVKNEYGKVTGLPHPRQPVCDISPDFEGHLFAVCRMLKFKPVCAQFQRGIIVLADKTAGTRSVSRNLSVFPVSGERTSQVGHLYPDLVMASGI